jgi:hypothetical protein
MADYYPLISRAVAGLEKNSGENRRALYERARAALLAQLRGVTPALNESDITRERLALEESIRKVEAEAARQFVEPSRQAAASPPKARSAEPRQTETRQPEARAEPRASETRAPEPRQRDTGLRDTGLRDTTWRDPAPRDADDDADSPPPRRYVNPPSSPAAEARQDTARRLRASPPPPPPSMPDRQSDTIFDRPLAQEPPPASPAPAQQRHPLRRPAGERRALLSESGLKDFRDVVSEANELGGASARAEKSARDAYNAVPAPAQDLDRLAERAERAERPTTRSFERPQLDRPQLDRSEPRMFEPTERQERIFEAQQEARPHEDFSEPMLEPSSFALDDQRPAPTRGRRLPPPIEDEEQYDEHEEEVRPRRSYGDLIKGLIAALIIIVIGALALWQWPNMVALYRAMRAPSTQVVQDPAASPTTTPKKEQSRIEPGSQQTPSQTPAASGGAAVAQKVVLYEEDPADPNGKRFVGSAIWRTETVTPGPGQPPELAVRADVEVPERKLAMTWSFRRNTDKGLPASHTVEIMFKLPPDFPSGGISNVPGILMKQAEQTRGVPLAGLAVKVTNGFYLIGLSSVDADKERNLQLLKERGWFDIPVVYNNNRRAILAMEKGTPGDRAFAEAFKAWKQ